MLLQTRLYLFVYQTLTSLLSPPFLHPSAK